MRTAPLTVRVLGARDEPLLRAFLEEDPGPRVYLAWRLDAGVLRRSSGVEAIAGAFRQGSLVAAAAMGGNLVPCGADSEALQALGALLRRMGLPGMVIGERHAVDALWPGFCRQGDAPVDRDLLHGYYECTQDTLVKDLALPQLCRADLADLDEVVAAHAAMILEDLGRDERKRNPESFRQRVRHLLVTGRVWLARRHGLLACKVHVGPESRLAAQLQGIYTAPALRGHGLARRATAETARTLLDRVPLVNLFVREDNQAARAAYEAAGFQRCGQFRMIIIDVPWR